MAQVVHWHTRAMNKSRSTVARELMMKKLFTMPDFPSRARLAGLRWHLKLKLAPEAIVAGLEVRTRHTLLCRYSIPL
jgi:hypothetical protein